MKKLFLLTTEFPYGEGEKPFIIPELEYLKQEFDITIISSASTVARNDDGKTTVLDKDINVLWYPCNHMGNIEKIRYSMQALVSSAFLSDAGNIIKDGRKILERLAYSLQFYAYSLRMYKWLKMHVTKDMTKDAIVYSFWYYIPLMASTMLKNRYGNFKLVSRAHGFDLYNERVSGGRQPFRNYIDKHLDKVFFIAENGYRYYLKNIVHMDSIDNKSNMDKEDQPSGTEKYKICRMGVKPSKRSESSHDGVLRIVSCSSVIPLKRISLIIDTLSEISGIIIKWTHFGDGSSMEEMKEYAQQKLSVRDNIEYKLAGNMPNKTIREYYGNNPVDLFITTSETEGCPVSIQEAMAAGIPIIGTNVGEIPLMIQGNGYLLSQNPEPNEIRDKVERFMDQSPEEIQKMRNASYELWNEKYNSDKNYPQLVNELMKL